MALAVLLDAVGQASQTPVFALFYLATLGLELAGYAVGNAFDLLLRDVIACNQHAFIKRHTFHSPWLEARGTAGITGGDAVAARQGRRGLSTTGVGRARRWGQNA